MTMPPGGLPNPPDHPTSFQRAVIAVVASLQAGDLATYAEVAAEAGHPGSAQAVANVLRQVPDLPWWRVIPSSGRLYRTHRPTQEPLLRGEGVAIDDTGKVVPEAGLNWIIEGSVAWHEHGLQTPVQVDRATLDYRKREDVLSRFATDVGIMFQPGAEMLSRDINDLLKNWCEEEGIRAPATKDIADWLQSNGCRKQRKRIDGGRYTVWGGITQTDEVPGETTATPTGGHRGQPVPVSPLRATNTELTGDPSPPGPPPTLHGSSMSEAEFQDGSRPTHALLGLPHRALATGPRQSELMGCASHL